MRVQHLLVLLAVVAATLVTALLWFDRSAAREAVPGPGPAADDETAAPAEEEPELAQVEDADDRDAIVEEAVEEATGEWIEGRVLFPEGSFQDPELRVYVYEGAPGTRWSRDRRPGERSAPVEPDGSFRIRLEEDDESGWIVASGRWLFSPRAIEAVPGTAAVLATEAGACLVGQVTLPGDEDPAVLEEVEVEIETGLGRIEIGGEMQRVSIEPAIAADGTFVVRGLPAGRDYAARAGHARLAGVELRFELPEAGVDRPLELVLHRGGTIHGTVVDDARAPVAGATVRALLPAQIFGLGGETAREAESDSGGRFRLEGVPPGPTRLVARAHGLLEGRPVPVEVTDGEDVRGVVLELSAGASIEGTVTWPDGSAAAGIDVDVGFDPAALGGLEAFNAMRGASGEAESDGSGRFRVTGLGKGPFLVRAKAKGRSEEDEDRTFRARAEGVAPDTQGLALVLRPPVGIAGRVIDADGRPVPLFRAFALRQVEGAAAAIAGEKRTKEFEDEDGRFALEDLTRGTWKLWILGPTHVTAEPTLAVADDDAEPVEVGVVLAARVKGRVVDPSGAPVSEATVRVGTGGLDLTRLTEGGPEPPETEADAQGRFDLGGIVPGGTTVTAEAKGWAGSKPHALDLAPGAVLEGVELVLSDGGNIAGEIYDDAGQPAAGRMVMVMATTGMSGGALGQRMVQSDSEGTFLFERVEAGPWMVIAMDQGRNWMAEEGLDLGSLMSGLDMAQVEVHEGETTHVVLGSLPEDPVRVFGRVTVADEPIPRAMITFHREGKPLLQGMTATAADTLGGYEVVLPAPDLYLIQVQQVEDTGRQSTVEFEVELEDVQEQRVDLALPLGRISGRLVGPDGRPAAGERVTLTPDGPPRSDRVWEAYTETVSDAEGLFDVIGLRPGAYRLSAGGGAVWAGGGSLGRVTLGDIQIAEDEWKEDLELHLPAPGTLRVTVRGPEGKPVAGATVFVRDEAGRPLEPFSFLSTDASGTLTYEGVAPGRVTVLARTSQLASRESGPVTVTEGAVQDVELVLESSAVLVVELVQRDGDRTPVRARVLVQDENGRDVSSFLGMTDLQALYGQAGLSTTEHRVGPIPPGRYTVRAWAGELTAVKSATVRGDEGERRLTVRLK